MNKVSFFFKGKSQVNRVVKLDIYKTKRLKNQHSSYLTQLKQYTVYVYILKNDKLDLKFKYNQTGNATL